MQMNYVTSLMSSPLEATSVAIRTDTRPETVRQDGTLAVLRRTVLAINRE